jgi:hypothetical protein
LKQEQPQKYHYLKQMHSKGRNIKFPLAGIETIARKRSAALHCLARRNIKFPLAGIETLGAAVCTFQRDDWL